MLPPGPYTKAEVLCQPPPCRRSASRYKTINYCERKKLKTTKTFPYLGSTISDDASAVELNLPEVGGSLDEREAVKS